MKREELKELQLSDEQIDKVMGLHGQTVNELNGKVASLTTERDTLTEQVTQSTQQLKELGKSNSDNKELQEQIKQLQEANTQLSTDGEAKLQEANKNYAVDLALREAGARDPKAVMPFIDGSIVKMDGGKLVGLDEQLKSIQADKDFLFQTSDNNPGDNKPNITLGGNATPPSGGEKSVVQKIQERLGK